MAPVSINYAEIAFGFFMYNYSIYLPEIILCLLQLIGVRSYLINGDKEKYKILIKKLEKLTYNSSFMFRNGKIIPSGYFIGYRCIGIYHKEPRYVEDETIRIITTQKFYDNLISEEDIEFSPEDKQIIDTKSELVKLETEKEKENQPLIPKQKKDNKSKVNVYMRSGQYKSFYYTSITLDVSHINPMGAQEPIVDDIVKIYNKKNRAAVFIYGVTLAGKSSIGYLVAKALKGQYCHTFNPTEPGDSFSNMLSEIKGRDEDDDKPLVIVIEEANELIEAVHNKTIKRHIEVSTQVKDKSSWCGFLDDMIFYKNIILILTSNESKENIDKMDPAYLRKGRIDETYSMMEQLPIADLM
jgi:hypothetical protein